MLMLIGERDPVSDVAAIEHFLSRAASTDKSAIRYPEMLHEVLRERGRQEAFEDVLRWMRERA
jgi:alpha-beta hydrolase superfamily lysophospholipase